MTANNIYTALLLCDFETIQKDSKNPHFKHCYASLPKILSIVLPVLKKVGIILSSHIPNAEPDTLVVTLTHAETETFLSSHIKLLNMSDMQKWGGCITYAIRYGLLSLLGIAADMDDNDGIDTLNSSVGKNNKQGYLSHEKTNNQTQVSYNKTYNQKPLSHQPKDAYEPLIDVTTPKITFEEKENLKKDLKTLWEFKKEVAIASDSAKGEKVKNYVSNNFMMTNKENNLVEVPTEFLFLIQDWLRNL